MNFFLKLIIVVGCLYPCHTYAQEMRICSYRSYMTEIELKKACNNFGYSSNADAEKVVDDILNNIGLHRNFIIKECPNISNAVAATVISSLGNLERYIIYDKEFFNKVKNITKTDWSSVSILAHEIGHHLNGHNLVSGIDNHQAELQADEFSGFVLAKMGVTLDESLRAINSFGSEENSNTHPKKSERIEAISNGWNKSNNNNFKIDNPDNIELYRNDKKISNSYYEMAITESKIGNHNLAGDYLFKAFQFSGGLLKEYLYYSASSYVNGYNYDKAIKYYLMLIKNGIESLDKLKQQEVYRNMALILVKKGKTEEAKKAISEARMANPEDTSLTLTEANLYLETKDFDMYKKLIAEVLEKNPNDVELIFNLGVLSANAKNTAEAEKYYKKVIEINPKYINGYINLAALKLENEKAIIDEMNKLGTSAKDMKRYDELKKKREDLFKSTIPYLEKAVELDPKNVDVSKTLLGVYSALEMTAEYKALKAKM